MEAYPMNGGNGPTSYSHNSSLQGKGIMAIKAMIDEAIRDHVDIKHLSSWNPYHIADLGCSVGPNTFLAVKHIIQALELKCSSEGIDSSKQPEFQVFFNDHVSNDFNTLFASPRFGKGRYFAAGVPGSFHGRLFPKASLHFLHSSYTLHWLSQVPRAVRDVKSPAWKRGRIGGLYGAPEVVAAYAAQFESDMDCFLRGRAQELVPGGLMALTLPFNGGWTDVDQPVFIRLFGLLDATLLDMVCTGRLDEDTVDSFNLPIHLPLSKEFEMLVKRNGYFSVEMIQPLPSSPKTSIAFDARLCCMHIRAPLEGIMRKHFGAEIVDEIFERLRYKVEESSYAFSKNMGARQDLFVLLKRLP
ncbi:loganic acid O-methyltransferase-like [Aristolochia californica]|uniref:loganic acid O-methyltransferase-like n=1 Tax=Aristolochia californica TaxID=171875 RepID=UPI0035D6E40C